MVADARRSSKADRGTWKDDKTLNQKDEQVSAHKVDRDDLVRSEADEFFRETYRLPVAGLALATLLLGDVAIVVPLSRRWAEDRQWRLLQRPKHTAFASNHG